MVDGLAAPPADVAHEPVARVGDPLVAGDLGDRREQPAEHRRVGLGQVGGGGDVVASGSRGCGSGLRGAMSWNAMTTSSSCDLRRRDLAARRSGRTGSPGQRRIDASGGGWCGRRDDADDAADDAIAARPGRRARAATRPTTFSRSPSARVRRRRATSVWSAAWPTQRPSSRRDSNRTSASPPTRPPAQRRPRVGGQREELGRAALLATGSSTWPAIRIAARAGPRASSGRRGAPAKPIDRMNSSERRQAVVVLGREADDRVARGSRRPGSRRGRARRSRRSRPRGSGGPSAGGRRRRRTGAAGGGAASSAARRRPRRGAARRRRAAARSTRGGSARPRVSSRIRRTRPASVRAERRVGAAEAALRPAAVVRPDVDPGQDDLAMAGAKRASDVGSTASGERLRSGPRAAGMMQ